MANGQQWVAVLSQIIGNDLTRVGAVLALVGTKVAVVSRSELPHSSQHRGMGHPKVRIASFLSPLRGLVLFRAADLRLASWAAFSAALWLQATEPGATRLAFPPKLLHNNSLS